jgi:hypothetical protein
MNYKKRNPVAKALGDSSFHQRVRDRRRHLLDELREHDADEDLYEFFGLGKAPKE